MTVAVVVLAAGEGSRFGGPKQRLTLPSVLERVIAAGAGEIVVVEGAHDLSDLPLPAGARLVHCTSWASGPGASLRSGVEALSSEVEAALIVLADGPSLSPAALHRVTESWRRDGGEAVGASYGGIRGHPLLVARSAWTRIPDEGLRALPIHLVACDDLGAPGDVDVPEDLHGYP